MVFRKETFSVQIPYPLIIELSTKKRTKDLNGLEIILNKNET